ncbi:hypothetical protein [Aquibium microcysteis]|uniref:hypothetical protein n=1 Tax=Aquibium microcysteis TaxID=675281 RepID=UPI00165CF955|nr:hypothetical protein [Aquibium microcysteis]
MSNLRIVAFATLATAAALPALAQTNDYGGYDIVSQRQGEYFYADTRGWRIFAARDGAAFAYCFADTDQSNGTSHRLGWDGMQWQLAVPLRTRPDWEGTLQIDGAGSGQGYGKGGDSISGTANAEWTIAWLGEAELDGIRRGGDAVLGVGKRDYDFSLSGATAATLKVQECVEQAGGGGPAAAPQPEPGASDTVRFGKAGSWVVNEIRDGRQTVACEALDPSQNPNLRFEIDRDNSYIDFRDGGYMGDLGERKPIRLLFGPGSSWSETEVEIIEGRDGDKWARISEGRSDGPGFLDDAIPNAPQVAFVGDNIILETPLDGTNRALDLFFRCSDKIR